MLAQSTQLGGETTPTNGRAGGYRHLITSQARTV